MFIECVKDAAHASPPKMTAGSALQLSVVVNTGGKATAQSTHTSATYPLTASNPRPEPSDTPDDARKLRDRHSSRVCEALTIIKKYLALDLRHHRSIERRCEAFRPHHSYPLS